MTSQVESLEMTCWTMLLFDISPEESVRDTIMFGKGVLLMSLKDGTSYCSSQRPESKAPYDSGTKEGGKEQKVREEKRGSIGGEEMERRDTQLSERS